MRTTSRDWSDPAWAEVCLWLFTATVLLGGTWYFFSTLYEFFVQALYTNVAGPVWPGL
jgi:hypothetical protein